MKCGVIQIERQGRQKKNLRIKNIAGSIKNRSCAKKNHIREVQNLTMQQANLNMPVYKSHNFD